MCACVLECVGVLTSESAAALWWTRASELEMATCFFFCGVRCQTYSGMLRRSRCVHVFSLNKRQQPCSNKCNGFIFIFERRGGGGICVVRNFSQSDRSAHRGIDNRLCMYTVQYLPCALLFSDWLDSQNVQREKKRGIGQ